MEYFFIKKYRHFERDDRLSRKKNEAGLNVGTQYATKRKNWQEVR